jgi:hypothetical protein
VTWKNSDFMKLKTVPRPAPNGLPDSLKEMPVNHEQANIIDAQFIVALRAHARRNGWKLKTRRADLLGQSFGVWRIQ